MKIKIIFCTLTLLLASCSTPVNTSVDHSINSVKSLNNSVSELKSQNKSGATLSVNLDFRKFSVKDNIAGTPGKTVNDISGVKLYLIKNDPLSGGGNISDNPLYSENLVFISPVLAYPSIDGNSNNTTYTFYSVPEGIYYVAAELFDEAQNNIIQPIPYNTDSNDSTQPEMIGLTLSSNTATVDENNNVTFSDDPASNSFKLEPKLKDAIGATIDTDIESNSGTNNIPDILVHQ